MRERQAPAFFRRFRMDGPEKEGKIFSAVFPEMPENSFSEEDSRILRGGRRGDTACGAELFAFLENRQKK